MTNALESVWRITVVGSGMNVIPGNVGRQAVARRKANYPD